MTKHLAAALAAAVLTLAGVGTVAPVPAAAAGTCNGVWVVVDYGSIGGTSTGCATDYGTGAAALRSAGFAPTLVNGMVTKITDKPGDPDLNKYYWSYWQSSQKADGSHAAWTYSKLGATASHPTKGNAEGWHYIRLSDAAAGPGVAPPDNPAPQPSPSPSVTSKSPKPTATASATKSPSPSASASKKPKPTPTPTPTTAASATPTSWPTPSAVPSTPGTQATPYVSQTVPDAPGDTGGSPVGLVVAAVVVVAGGGGLGLWWYLRGRKR